MIEWCAPGEPRDCLDETRMRLLDAHPWLADKSPLARV